MAIKAFSEIKESNMVSNPEFSSSTLSHIIVNFYYTSMLYLDYNPIKPLSVSKFHVPCSSILLVSLCTARLCSAG